MLSRLRDARAHASEPYLLGNLSLWLTQDYWMAPDGEVADEAVEEYVVEQSDRQTDSEARGHQQTPFGLLAYN
jgi:hypothetical protein